RVRQSASSPSAYDVHPHLEWSPFGSPQHSAALTRATSCCAVVIKPPFRIGSGAHHDYCCSALVSLFSQRLFSWQMYSMISPFGTQLMSNAMVQGRVYAPGSSMVA